MRQRLIISKLTSVVQDEEEASERKRGSEQGGGGTSMQQCAVHDGRRKVQRVPCKAKVKVLQMPSLPILHIKGNVLPN